MAQTEHMPWIWAVNSDYVEVCNIPPLPKDPVRGQVLDPTPKPLAFAASVYPVASPAIPITSPVMAGMRCTMVQHEGAYAAVRHTQPQVAPAAQIVPTQVLRRAPDSLQLLVLSQWKLCLFHS